MSKKRILVVALIGLAIGAVIVNRQLDQFRVDLPVYQRPPELVMLSQTWTDDQRQPVPSHGARHAPAAGRVVQGSRAALLLAVRVRQIRRQRLPHSLWLHPERADTAEPGRLADWLCARQRLRRSGRQAARAGGGADVRCVPHGRAPLRQVRGADRRRAGDDRARRVPEGAWRRARVQHHVSVQDRSLRAVRARRVRTGCDGEQEARAEEPRSRHSSARRRISAM